MPQYSIAENLCRLAKDFKSGDPVQAGTIKKEFKIQSKNDIARVVVYLMEVIGSRDEAFKKIQSENADLKELLNLKAPGWDKEENGQESSGSDGVAAAGTSESVGIGGAQVTGSPIAAEAQPVGGFADVPA